MLDVASARAAVNKRLAVSATSGPQVGREEDRTIQTGAGPIMIRIFRPKQSAAAAPPILIYYHGGGFVVGTVDSTNGICRDFTDRLGCITVSIDYRLAPEHKFPVPVDDSYAATVWIASHAAEIGGDPERIALAGESAGGTLCAVISAQARDTGDFKIVQQVMIYPGTDMVMDSPSYSRLGEGYFLTLPKMRWFRDHYLRDERDALDPKASPLRGKDFSRLPPTLVITAGLDPLVDEGAAYADRLKGASVPVEYVCLEGWLHGFLYWPGCEALNKTMDLAADCLKRSFARN